MLENVKNGSIIEVKITSLSYKTTLLYVIQNDILADLVQFCVFFTECIGPDYYRFIRGEIFSMSGVQLNYLLYGANKYETWTVL